MIITIIEPKKYYILVEYENKGIQRKWISRDLVNISIRGSQINLRGQILSQGIDYSDVNLKENLGFMTKSSIHCLEQAMRKAGLWTRQDYIENPNIVAKVVQSLPVTLDVATIINAAVYIGDQNGG